MNTRLICHILAWIALLIAATMTLSLPWALPHLSGTGEFNAWGFGGLMVSVACSLGVALILWRVGRGAEGELFRREAMAVVALSWIMATLLGALPFLFCGVYRAPDHHMTVMDAVFESASGFTGAGATVITDLEDPLLTPCAILFWRSSTHFLGGLGIIVLFVAVLGQGSAGKALMRAEMPGPTKTTDQHRMQHAAWTFGGIYVGLNVILTALLMIEGMGFFDALCHAFGTIATGGFSTYNDSVAHFHSPVIEMTIAAFMALACVNFTLLYYVVLLKPAKLLADAEFRVYIAILLAVIVLVMVYGVNAGDFKNFTEAVRYSIFQVVSIMTNTGFGTHDFDSWNAFGRAVLFLVMFIGGCAGSTSCSIKVIRYILLFKILKLEFEHSFHPTVVRPLRMGGETADPDLRRTVPLYFSLVLVVVAVSWILLIMFEPTETWTTAGRPASDKLMDCASGVAATVNGVGPGLGIVGATRNFAPFNSFSKLVFTLLMLLGRLEFFPILILTLPSFWRRS